MWETTWALTNIWLSAAFQPHKRLYFLDSWQLCLARWLVLVNRVWEERPNATSGPEAFQYFLPLLQPQRLPLIQVKALVAQLCSILYDRMDHKPPDSSVCGILQARTLEWVAISLSKRSFQPRDRTCISCSGKRILYCWATREAHC